jgi:hypothetical protein
MTRGRNWLALFAVFGVLGLLMTEARAAQASTLGRTTVGASNGGGLVANAKRVNAYRLTVPASVSKLDIYLSPSGTAGSQVMEGVIYADAGGSPGALVARSLQVSFSRTSTAGWRDLPFASAAALSPGKYWLGVYTGATSAVASYRYDAGASARTRSGNNQTYVKGGASDPFGAVAWGDNHVMSLYATYTTPAWALQSLPAPVGSSRQLSGVSCASTTACTAVGSYQDSSGVTVTLAERWNGTSWSIQATPSIGDYSVLSGVSCTSSTSCTAVGGSSASGHDLLAERWNGTSWSLEATPNPPNTISSSFNAVSCTSSTACTAVGTLSYGPQAATFAERWSGTSWSLQKTPNTGDYSLLSAVSCVSSTDCTAVGSSSLQNGPQVTLAERWDGTTWSIQATPNPAQRESALNGVSCPSTTNCAAVGASTGASAPELPLAERYVVTGAWELGAAQARPGSARTRAYPRG